MNDKMKIGAGMVLGGLTATALQKFGVLGKKSKNKIDPLYVAAGAAAGAIGSYLLTQRTAPPAVTGVAGSVMGLDEVGRTVYPPGDPRRAQQPSQLRVSAAQKRAAARRQAIARTAMQRTVVAAKRAQAVRQHRARANAAAQQRRMQRMQARQAQYMQHQGYAPQGYTPLPIPYSAPAAPAYEVYEEPVYADAAPSYEVIEEPVYGEDPGTFDPYNPDPYAAVFGFRR